MTRREPAVLVMAEAPVPGACERGLEPLLGADGCARLQRVLIARAVAWAFSTSTLAYVCFPAAGPAAGDAVRAVVPEAATLLPRPAGEDHAERLSAVAQEVFAGTDAPLVVIGTRLPGLGDYHAAAVFSDFEDGCDTVLGIAIRGGLYLLGLREPVAGLLALVDERHDGEQTRRLSRDVAAEEDLVVGMLHYERTLSAPADVAALLADPLLPADVAAALAPGLEGAKARQR